MGATNPSVDGTLSWASSSTNPDFATITAIRCYYTATAEGTLGVTATLVSDEALIQLMATVIS